MAAIEETDLKVFLAAEMSDAATNGGRMGAVPGVDGLAGQIWPSVQKDERTAGSTKYRKIFHKNDNAADVVLQNGRLFLAAPTVGDGAVYLFPGTHTDQQSDITGSEDLFGAGELDADVSALATGLDVLVEDGAVPLFRDGELVYISDGANSEFVTLNGDGSVAGDIVTLAFTTGLVNSYLAADTYVSSVIEHGEVKPAVTAPVVTAAGSGAYAAASLGVHNLGTTRDSWTLTFINATTFDAVGSVAGAIGSGNISSDYAPNNPNTGTPFFTLGSAGFSGVFQAGDTITFTTSPAAVPLWQKRVIPAAADPSSGNEAASALWGESP